MIAARAMLLARFTGDLRSPAASSRSLVLSVRRRESRQPHGRDRPGTSRRRGPARPRPRSHAIDDANGCERRLHQRAGRSRTRQAPRGDQPPAAGSVPSPGRCEIAGDWRRARRTSCGRAPAPGARSSGQTHPPATATGLQHRASGACRHALAEAVTLGSLGSVWLKRPLHRTP